MLVKPQTELNVPPPYKLQIFFGCLSVGGFFAPNNYKVFLCHFVINIMGQHLQMITIELFIGFCCIANTKWEYNFDVLKMHSSKIFAPLTDIFSVKSAILILSKVT